MDGDLPVIQAITEIMTELGGVPKGGYNSEQRYNFRGIEDLLVRLNPLLAKYGVVIVPDVIERFYEARTSAKGTQGHCAHLHVRYTVYGPGGDSITLSTWGEGVDYSDKGTNKAMTAAFKYALLQLFAVCDPAEDADREGPEAGVAAPPELQALIGAIAESGLNRKQQKIAIEGSLGITLHDLRELSAEEMVLATRAIESAAADLLTDKEDKW